jgi:hypothetical protein
MFMFMFIFMLMLLSLLPMVCNIFRLSSPTFESKWLNDGFKLTERQVLKVIEECQ